MKPRRVSMRDVATASGVTAATVSRAMRQDPRLSEETKKRVGAAAARLGYTLIPELSVLMGACRRQKVPVSPPKIALLSALDSPSAWASSRSPNINGMYRGARARAEELGFSAEDIWSGDFDGSAERIEAHLRARGIRRVLIGPSTPPAVTPSLNPREFTVVTLGAAVFPGVTAVFNDHYLACVTAVRECHRMGYRRPGLILRAYYNQRDQGRWEAGYLIGIDAMPGMAALPVLRISAFENEEEFNQWYRQERPDVILSATVPPIEKHAKRLGLAVPKDLGLVSLGSSRMGGRDSGIFQDSPYVGQRAVDLLVELSTSSDQGAGDSALNFAIAGHWNQGRTVRPVRA